MMRVYMDEDAMSDALVRALRQYGFDVETAEEAGLRATPDEDHLRYAASQGRTLYSFNRGDYTGIHWRWIEEERAHAGIVLLGDREVGVGMQARRWVDLARDRGQAGMVNYLAFL